MTGRTLFRLSRGDEFYSVVVAFSPDGRRLACAGTRGSVAVWDTATWRKALTFEGHDGQITAIAYSPDGRSIASGGSDRTVPDLGCGERPANRLSDRARQLDSRPGIQPRRESPGHGGVR